MRSFVMIIISFYNMGQLRAGCILDISNFMILLVTFTKLLRFSWKMRDVR